MSSPSSPPAHSRSITALLTRCKVMSALAATRLKGISLFHVGFFFSECWHYIERKSMGGGPLDSHCNDSNSNVGTNTLSLPSYWKSEAPSPPVYYPTPFIHAQPHHRMCQDLKRDRIFLSSKNKVC